MICPCPKSASLTAIPAAGACKFKFDQVLRLGFQRNTDSNPFDATTLITAQAAWDTLIAATDDTKVVFSPIIFNPIIPSSEELTEGGNDNTTPFGIEQYLGEGSVKVTGEFRNVEPAVKKALAALSCESDVSLGVANLRVYMINKDGQIIHEVDPDAAAEQRGIAIYNFRVGSMGSQGFNSDNVVPFSFSMSGNWDEEIAMVKPAFNMLTY